MQDNFIKRRRFVAVLWLYLIVPAAWLVNFKVCAQEKNPEQVATAPAANADAPPAAQQSANFDLFELRVKGNTKLERKDLERCVYPFLGPNKNIEDVDKARSALEELYRSQGYQTVAVDIPEQDVKNGIVYLQVVEGRISRLRVKDSRYFSLGKIKEGVPELAEGNVPNMPVMQQQLATLAAQSPDRQIQPVLRAGEIPGTLEVDLKVKDELPLHGRVELNGRNTATTSRLRLVSSLHYDNLWQAMHSASLMYTVSPEDNNQVDVWAGTYAVPLFDNGTRLAFYTVSSNSDSLINTGADSISNGSIYGLRLVRPLGMVDNYYHSLSLGVDYKDFRNNITAAGTAPGILTPITYTPFLAQYSGNLRGKESYTTFDLGLHFSMRSIGNNQNQFQNARNGARADYVYLTGDLKFLQNLPMGMEMQTHFSGQAADTPLINYEQYLMGGSTTVRGYFETQALADNGLLGSVEFRSPHLGMADWDAVNQLKVLAFLEGAKGWVKSALPGTVSDYTLSSGGFGMRFKVFKQYSGAFDVGIPFNTILPVHSGDPRLHFNIATDF